MPASEIDSPLPRIVLGDGHLLQVAALLRMCRILCVYQWGLRQCPSSWSKRHRVSSGLSQPAVLSEWVVAAATGSQPHQFVPWWPKLCGPSLWTDWIVLEMESAGETFSRQQPGGGHRQAQRWGEANCLTANIPDTWWSPPHMNYKFFSLQTTTKLWER